LEKFFALHFSHNQSYLTDGISNFSSIFSSVSASSLFLFLTTVSETKGKGKGKGKGAASVGSVL
jgi:hypothetical protein